jgi:CzcA family heavy metal efflux pump
MIREMVALSLRFRVLVVGVAAAVLAMGVTRLPDAAVDAFPEFTPVQVQIQTEALGLSAAEVEQLITVPIEQDLLNGVAWLQAIRSESVPGLSSIDLIFEPGTDVLKARQLVQERMTQAHALPAVGSPPVMIQPLSSTSRVMMIGLAAKDVSLIDLSVLARWKIKPRLMGVPGVANVAIWGQRDRQLQVQIDPDRLRRSGVSLSQVISTTGNALWVSPLTFVEASTPGTGGFVDTSNQRFAIQHVLPIATARQLSSVTVEDTGGRRLRLSDVASVVEDHQPLIGDAVLSDGPGLMLVIEKFPEANTREVTKGVEDALNALRPGLSGIEIDPTVYRPDSLISAALGNLGRWALIALILVLLLLLAALRSWRLALVGFAAMSVSLVAAAYVLYLRGATFNVMVLVGLAIALGAVIDDAVVHVADIRRRLARHRAAGGTGSAISVIPEASAAIRGPLVFATLIALLAPLPLLFLSGVAGAFARPMVLSYALAVAASTLVALTLTPALAAILLRDTAAGRRPVPLAGWVNRGFDRVVPRFLGRPRLAYGAVAVLVLASVAVMPQLDSRSLLPSPRDRDLLIHWQAAAGTSLPEMTRITAAAARELRAVPGVRGVGAHVGRAVTSDQVVNVNSGELWVSLAGSADYDATVTAVRRVVQGYPGLRADLRTYPVDRVRAVQTGTGDALVVRVYGQDLTALRGKAEEMRRAISTVRGVVQPRVQAQPEEPTLEVTVDLAAARRYGIKPGDVRRAAATFFSGLPVGNLYEEQKVFDVVVWGAPTTRYTPGNLQDLLIDAPAGGHVRLGDVAAVRIAPYPTVIRHDATSRSVDVTAGVSGRDPGSVIRDVRNRIRTVAMPQEYHAEVLGDVTQQQNEDRRTMALVLAVVMAVLLVLQAALGSWRLATLLLLTLPLAGAGGVLAAFLVGGIMSLGALAGFFTVLALAARWTLLLVRGYQRLEQDEGAAPGLELVLGATRERVGPVLLSGLATALAVAPLAVLGDLAGVEVLYPFAVVVLGGLVTSTLLTLVVVPALYLRFSPGVRRDRPSTPPSPAPAAE